MKRFALVLTLFIATQILNAQSVYEFLRVENSPRAAAMAGSFVSNTDDPNVLFYNPAGIGMLDGQPASFSFLKHLVDIKSASLSYSRNVESIGRFAAGVQYMNYGEFTRADEFANKIGTFGASDFAFSIGYSNILDQNFYYGISSKFIYSGIADRSSSAVAMDIGLLYVIPESKWSFGFSVLNMGTQLSNYVDTNEDLPLDIKVGASKTLAHLPFTFYLALNKLNEKGSSIKDKLKYFTFGGEFRISKVLRLRFGYDNEKRKDLKIGTTAGLAGFSIGLGANVSKYKIDYAYSSLGSIGAFHRFGLSTNLALF